MTPDIQESFLLEILLKNFANLTVISEKVYKKKGSDYRGPDITIIENNKLITIEVKAKHITLDTCLSQDSECLIKDMTGAFSALQKLKDEKIPDFYSGLEIYKDFQDKLNETKQVKPICIVVIGEGIFSLQEHLNLYARKNQSFFLNSFGYPFCIIDVFHFCKALDVAKSNNITLYSLFSEYWEIGSNLNPKRFASDEFGGRKIDLKNSVLAEYWEEIMNYMKARLHNQRDIG